MSIKREPVKPSSKIGNWGSWPSDVEGQIRSWNKSGHLTFVRMRKPFTCAMCREMCQAHVHGAARYSYRKPYHGALRLWVMLCDDCLILFARTRVAAVEGEPPERGWDARFASERLADMDAGG